MDRSALESKFASRTKKIRLEEFDCEVTIHGMTARERAEFTKRSSLLQKDENKDDPLGAVTKELMCFVVACGLLEDETGKHCYSEGDADRIMDSFPCTALDEIHKGILGMSGLQIGDQVKNSDPTPSDVSS